MFFPDSPLLDFLCRTLLLGPICIVGVIFTVRVLGLRSFSKMNAFDFITTVASGSLVATAAAANQWSNFFQATLAIFSLLGFQALLAFLRRRSEKLESLISNEPALLFKNGEFQRETMRRVRVEESDLWAKMREANVLALEEVEAIVLETTGDVSVLHGRELEPQLLSGLAGEQNPAP